MDTKLLPSPQLSLPKDSLTNQNISVTTQDHSTSIDDVISKIGFGSYQLKSYLILGLVLMNDGAESLVLSILQNILKTEWNLSSTQTDWVGTAVFIGFLLGSLVSGKVSDRYGRRKPLLFLSLALYLVGMGSAFAINYAGLIITRSSYGFLVGIQFPMCFTYLTEITPKEVRGRCLVLAGGFFTLGELLTCGVSFFTLNGITSGNWRLLLICIAQPALLCWIGIVFILHESPRYLIVSKKELKQGIDVLKKMAGRNNDKLLGDDVLHNMERWVKSHKNLKRKHVGSVFALFRDQTKVITFCLWPIWFILSLSYYGMVYILPQVVSAMDKKQNNNSNSGDLWSITLPALGELPSLFLVVFIVERDFFGRKKSMIGGFILTSVLCALVAFASDYDIWATGARTILNGVFTIASPYTAELYQTTIRTTGLGMASACSRVGGAVMPWVTQVLFDIHPRVPFLGFAILCLLGSLFCFIIPYDTTNKELDFEYKRKKNTVGTDDKLTALMQDTLFNA